jgi:WxL domain surface cell wall-binding
MKHNRKLASMAAAAALLLVSAAPAFAAGGISNAALTGGSLAITGAAPGNFSGTLSAASQNLYTTLAPFTATDPTGSGSGWHLTIQATSFITTTTPVRTLPASSLYMAAPTVACTAATTPCLTTTSAPTVTAGPYTLDSGTAVTLASSAVNTGMGAYDFTPADIAGGTTGMKLELVVPASAYAGSYNSTLTVSIVSLPV